MLYFELFCWLFVSGSRSVTSVGKEKANLSAIVCM